MLQKQSLALPLLVALTLVALSGCGALPLASEPASEATPAALGVGQALAAFEAALEQIYVQVNPSVVATWLLTRFDMDISFWDSLWQTLFVRGAALTIFLAGLSDGLGTQSIVLLVNRITPRRFAINLALSIILYFLGALAWMASIWLAGSAVLGDYAPLPEVIGAVSLAYIPLWFSALLLIPYFGQAIGILLNGWSLVIALTAVSQVFQVGLVQALAGTALGWLLMLLVRYVLSRPSERLGHWLWAITTGHDTRIDIDSVPLTFSAETADQAGVR